MYTVKVQLVSAKGFLGPPFEFKILYISQLTEKLMTELDKMTEVDKLPVNYIQYEYEGVNVIDWTKISILIERGQQ